MWLGISKLDSGAGKISPAEPNWMVWQAEGEASRVQVDTGPFVGLESLSD